MRRDFPSKEWEDFLRIPQRPQVGKQQPRQHLQSSIRDPPPASLGYWSDLQAPGHQPCSLSLHRKNTQDPGNSIFKKDLFLLFLSVCTYIQCPPDTSILELELQKVVTCHVGAGNSTPVVWNNNTCS